MNKNKDLDKKKNVVSWTFLDNTKSKGMHVFIHKTKQNQTSNWNISLYKQLLSFESNCISTLL